eukprot:TRINITY_DN236_c2_g1_i1.p1 TRINITY_DN236_c2_g1~~TRINITY_DN236_c2_g1_i1.p1  ORF type:complete len:1265 (+),score=280.74 TRINITY_DN236_c2_g1_i1:97-3795(+)
MAAASAAAVLIGAALAAPAPARSPRSAAASAAAPWTAGFGEKWTLLLPNPPGQTAAHFSPEGCAAAVGTRIFAFGGEDGMHGGAASGILRVFDVETRKWTQVPPSPSAPSPGPRYSCKMASDPPAGHLYLFGGKRKVEQPDGTEQKTALADLWRLRVGDLRWEQLDTSSSSAPPAGAYDAAAAVAGGFLVLAGSDDGEHPAAWRYSLSTGTWYPPIQDPRLALDGPLLVALPGGESAFLIGGSTPSGVDARYAGLTLDPRGSGAVGPAAVDAAAAEYPAGPGAVGGVVTTADGSVLLVSTAGVGGGLAVHSLPLGGGTPPAWQREVFPAAAQAPEPREEHWAVVVGNVLVLFGGKGPRGLLGDVWAYNYSGRAVEEPQERTPDGSALQEQITRAKRSNFSGWVDYEARRTAPWVKVLDNPIAASADVMLARLGDRVYIYGGESNEPGTNKYGSDRLLILDLLTLDFTVVPRSDPWPPGQREGYAAVDPVRRKMYLFGGKNQHLGALLSTQLWELDIATLRWRNLYTPTPATTPPTGAVVSTPTETSQTKSCMRGLGAADPKAPNSLHASDSSLTSTRDFLIVAGSDKAECQDIRVWDKRSEAWMDPVPAPLLQVEDPLTLPLTEYDDCCAVYTQGQDEKGGLKRYVVGVNTTSDPWDIYTLVDAEDAIPGEDSKAGIVSGGFLLIGDDNGQGPLSSTSGIARYHHDRRNFSYVNQGSGDCRSSKEQRSSGSCLPLDQWWLPSRHSFATFTFRDKLAVFGGVLIAEDGSTALSGELWVYDNDLCPLNCSGRGSCVFGNCQCRGSRGLACQVTTTETEHIWLWVLIGVLGVGLLVAPPVVYKYYRQWWQTRRLYTAQVMAASCAESIALMEFEKVKYIEEIANPSQLQRAFIDIIRILRHYRSFLPDAIFVAEPDCISECDSEPPDAGNAHDESAELGSSTSSGPSTLQRQSQTNSSFAGTAVSTPRMERLPTGAALPGGFSGQSLHHRRVSVLWVGLNRFHDAAVGDLGFVRTHSEVTDAVLTEFGSFKGVQDHMAGDRHMCTFGACKAAHDQRLCAALCTLRVTARLSELTPHGAHAGVDSGFAHVGTLGATQARKHSVVGVVVNSAFLAARGARLHRVPAVAGERVYDETFSRVQYRALTAWASEKFRPHRVNVLYEICHEKSAQAMDEWMYEMQRSLAADPYESLNRRMREASRQAPRRALPCLPSGEEALEEMLKDGGCVCNFAPIEAF